MKNRSVAVAEAEIAEFYFPLKYGVLRNSWIGSVVVDSGLGFEQFVNTRDRGGSALE